jgi:cyclophilin family peptidyl-prolyl cis-trans isomerase/protein-disulfide isomerase
MDRSIRSFSDSFHHLALNMRKFSSLAIVLAWVLAACAQSADKTNSQASTTPSSQPHVTQAVQSPAGRPGCTVVTRQPTPGPTEQAIIPLPGEKDWTRGPQGAYVTMVEYSDFQCPTCAGLEPVLERLLEENPKDLRLVFRHYPLSVHDKAALATQAAEAAGLQGKFWEMHDLLFEKSSEWIDLTVADFQDWLIGQAPGLGLDVDQFTSDLTSTAMVKLAKEAFDKNLAIGMPGTPFIMINGRYYNGLLDYGNLQAVISIVLLEKRQFSDCPPMTIDPGKDYFAIVHTEKGDITIELFADKAPLAVNNFIFLAKKGWYDEITFHRVIPGYIAQAGDPSGTGFGGPGYAFDNEIAPGLKFDSPGVVGMANAGPGSNGSQFFITFTAAPQLDGSYTIFGRVISGMDVAVKLTPRNPGENMDLPPGDIITSVTIEEK